MTAPFFFRAIMDMEISGRRLYAFPMSWEGRRHAYELTGGVIFQGDGPVPLRVSGEGFEVDFSYAVDAKVPVVSARAAELFARVAGPGVRVLPAAIDGAGDMSVLHILTTADCVAWDQSVALYDKRTGKPNTLIECVIDPLRAPPVPIFRVLPTFVVVTRPLRDAIVAAGLTGADFMPLRTTPTADN